MSDMAAVALFIEFSVEIGYVNGLAEGSPCFTFKYFWNDFRMTFSVAAKAWSFVSRISARLPSESHHSLSLSSKFSAFFTVGNPLTISWSCSR